MPLAFAPIGNWIGSLAAFAFALTFAFRYMEATL